MKIVYTDLGVKLAREISQEKYQTKYENLGKKPSIKDLGSTSSFY